MTETTLTIPNPVTMRTELQGIMSEKEVLIARVMNIAVTDEATKIEATELLTATLAPLRKKLEIKRKEYSTTLRRLATAWDAEFNPPLAIIDGLISYLKLGIKEFILAQEKKARELQEELDRKAAEEEAARALEIAKAEAEGRPIPEQQIPEIITPLAPEVNRSVKTNGGSASLKRWPVLDIFDESLLPREYLVPNATKILDTLNEGIKVPGAQIIYRDDVTIRPK